MYNLTMQYSNIDFDVPLEEDGLSLSFQRTARPRNCRLDAVGEGISDRYALKEWEYDGAWQCTTPEQSEPADE